MHRPGGGEECGQLRGCLCLGYQAMLASGYPMAVTGTTVMKMVYFIMSRILPGLVHSIGKPLRL